MASITSRIGVDLGSFLGLSSQPQIGPPNRAPVTGDPPRFGDFSAGDFGTCLDDRIRAPEFCSPILGVPVEAPVWATRIAPWLRGNGHDLGAQSGPIWATFGRAEPSGWRPLCLALRRQNRGVVLAMNLIIKNHDFSKPYTFIGRP